MALKDLIAQDDPRLREVCNPVVWPDPSLISELNKLHNTLEEFRDIKGFGRAIAAPQLGIMKRMIAVNFGANRFALINPEFTWHSKSTQAVWDDCLSLPEIVVRVSRHESISLTYQNEQGEHIHWEKLSPDLAELVQHEVDHLNGILMTERAIDANSVRPVSDHAKLVGSGRAAHRLSLNNIREAHSVIDNEFKDTPQYNCEPLSERLGCEITLKLEIANPIRSFKGRGAAYFLDRCCRSQTPVKALVTASAGNWGQALAYCARARNIPITIFAATNASPLKVQRMQELGATIKLEGEDFDSAKEAATLFAMNNGCLMIEDGKQTAIAEGHGTIAVELLQHGQYYDDWLVPLGNGSLATGTGRWIKASAPPTRVSAVCAAKADSMYQSWKAGTVVTTDTAATIADGIAVRIPVPESVADLAGTVDQVVCVSDEAIIIAMQLLRRYAGLLVEPSGASALAVLVEKPELFANHRVAAVICGSNITDQQIAEFELV